MAQDTTLPKERSDDGDRWFDLEELAKYSSLSVRTLQRWIKDPERPLPHHQVQPAGKGRGRTVVSRHAFDAWMEQFAVKAPEVGDADWVRRGFKKQ
jgi:hypothetical protein